MGLKFKKGDKVVQVVKPFHGEVVGAQIIDGTEIRYEVAYTGEDGEQHGGFFTEDAIAVDEAAIVAAEAQAVDHVQV